MNIFKHWRPWAVFGWRYWEFGFGFRPPNQGHASVNLGLGPLSCGLERRPPVEPCCDPADIYVDWEDPEMERTAL